MCHPLHLSSDSDHKKKSGLINSGDPNLIKTELEDFFGDSCVILVQFDLNMGDAKGTLQ